MTHETSRETLKGGCHCGAVQFRVEAELPLKLVYCNCSICRMTGFLHLFVARDEVVFDCGEDLLTDYRFNTGVARHLFCPKCGVKPLYVPRSHPDGWSVNGNCLDPKLLKTAVIEDFDGQNWEQNIDQIR